jgi:four helix bundle protein
MKDEYRAFSSFRLLPLSFRRLLPSSFLTSFQWAWGKIVLSGHGGLNGLMTEYSLKQNDLKKRTKLYALAILDLYAFIPNNLKAQIIAKQILRSGTSVGANYREACRAKSNADFISKVETVLQELEETAYWLELLQDGNILSAERVSPLADETHQLIAIFVTIVKGVKRRKDEG